VSSRPAQELRPADDGTHRRRAWQRLAALTSISVPTVLVGVHGAFYGRWLVDDAAITFAYARSVATGAGPVLQPGAEPVEGFSNPAWLAILTVGRWLGLFDHGAWFGIPDYVLFPKSVALMCCAGMFTAVYVIARQISSRPAVVTALAGAATAAVPSFVIWVVSGLENPLLALIVAWLAAVLVRATLTGTLLTLKVAAVCAGLAAVAALTRPDGAAYAAAYPLTVLLQLTRSDLAQAARKVLVSVAVFAAPVGGYLVWRVLTFGRWLPNTAIAKAQQLPGLDALAKPNALVGYAGWLAVTVGAGFVSAAFALGRARVSGSAQRALAVLLVVWGLAVAVFVVLQEDWMAQYRFATPIWLLTAALIALAVDRVLPTLATRGRAITTAILVIAGIVTTANWADAVKAFRRLPTVPMCWVAVTAGTTINDYASILGLRSGTLLVPDVGGTALTSTLRIVDLAGLADARIADYWATNNMTGLRDHVFNQVRPTFIETHDFWSNSTGIVADPRMKIDYTPISSTDTDSGVWVRQDTIHGPQLLDQARHYATTTAQTRRTHHAQAQLASCGTTLRPTTTQTPDND
jgi:hypothetical protein